MGYSLVFHLACFTAAIDSTADTDVSALTDDILTIQNGHFVLSEPREMRLAYAASTTLARAKIASPSMRQIASPFIRPIGASTLPATDPSVAWMIDQPFQLRPFEEIQCLATSGVAMGTERFYGLIWTGKGFYPWPVGNPIPLRFTSSTACVANTWTTLAVTFADTIPSGLYAMLLSEHFSTNGVAHRWIVSNQLERPGHLSYSANTKRHPVPIYRGGMGAMGQFRSNDLPRLQALANSTDNSHEGYLWVTKVGNLSPS